MSIPKMAKAMEYIDDDLVSGAVEYKRTKKKNSWMKWGAIAVCLCLVVVGAFVFQNGNIGPIMGTVDEEIKRIAVFPATETIENVETATIESITETDAYSMDILGEYLPTQLPEGYAFEKGSILETTMKNGTKYHMLRAIYSKIDSSSTQTEDGELAPDPNALSDNFTVFVMDYKPNTDKRLYSVTDITETLLAEIEGQVFHIVYGDIYVGISDMVLSTSDIMTVINSIGLNGEVSE